MTPEQCVEMMEALRDAFSRVSLSKNTPQSEILKLKNTLMLIEMSVISMRYSMERMLKN
jgi:hypothetical protein